MRKWRKMTWVLLIWSVVFAIWIAAGVGGNDCAQQATELDQSACEAGTGIGVALVFFLWFIGFIVLALIWFMTRPKSRDCPACGESVKKGVMQCKSCGFDFRSLTPAGQAGGGAGPQPPQAPPAAS